MKGKGAGILVLITAGFIAAMSAYPVAAAAAAHGRTEDYRSPFVEIAQNVGPSVVQITTARVEVIRRRAPEDFERFFGVPVPEEFREFFEQHPPEERERRREGLGSGVIISREGHIITNYHVVQGVSEVQVKLLDEDRLHTAEIIGVDQVTDLAVVKINTDTPLTPARLGDSNKLQSGEWAIAIGNPFGLEKTVTVGVISALGRAGFPGLPRYQDFIQTDASINLGNSGGALVNIKGEVVGINTFIMSPFIAQGLGFAIPVNIVKNVYEQILEHGRVSRGYLGVVPQDISPAMARMWGLPDTEGVVIAHVQPGTPADRAGMEVGDIVLEFDGQKVEHEQQFRRMIADTPAEKEVEIRVMREGEETLLTAVLDDLPVPDMPDREPEDETKLGFEARDITPEFAERYGIEDTDGVVITGVRGGTMAERLLRPGDIVIRINIHRINNMTDYRAALREIQPGEEIVLLVRRGESTFFAELRAE